MEMDLRHKDREKIRQQRELNCTHDLLIRSLLLQRLSYKVKREHALKKSHTCYVSEKGNAFWNVNQVLKGAGGCGFSVSMVTLETEKLRKKKKKTRMEWDVRSFLTKKKRSIVDKQANGDEEIQTATSTRVK